MIRLLAEEQDVAAVSRQAAAHLSECPRCRELVVQWSAAPLPAVDGAAPAKTIASQLTADLRPVRPLPADGWLAGRIAAGGTLVAAAFVLVMGTRGWHLLGAWQFASFALLFLGVTAYLLFGLPGLMRPGAPPPRFLLAALAALVLLYPAASLLLFPWSPEAGRFVSDGVFCLTAGMPVALLTAAAAVAVARRGWVLESARTGWAIAGLGAAVSAASLQVFCPHLEASHLVVWHFLVILVSLAGGAIAARFLAHA